MLIQGKYVFNASPQEVWDVLMSPDNLGSCMPGCEKLESNGEDSYRASMNVGVANIKGRFQGTVAMIDKKPYDSYRLKVEGNGKPGFIHGEAIVSFVDQGDETLLIVEGQAEVGGLIARVGQRLLGRASKMIMDKTFKCLQKSQFS